MFIPEQIHRRMATETPAEEAYAVLFYKNDMIVPVAPEGDICLPVWRQVASLASAFAAPPARIGEMNGVPVFGAEFLRMPEPLPAGLAFISCRGILGNGNSDEWQAVARAREIIVWRNRHRLCGACGQPLLPSPTDLGLICPACHAMYFPQIAPAVIVAVWRNNRREVLLAHNSKFTERVFGLIAGFVEAGETVEQAIAREIYEETQVRVKNIQYIHSQSWPFPNSLMLGFTAEYASGTATPDGEELTELGWFSKESMPLLPGIGSVARAIINKFFDEQQN